MYLTSVATFVLSVSLVIVLSHYHLFIVLQWRSIVYIKKEKVIREVFRYSASLIYVYSV